MMSCREIPQELLRAAMGRGEVDVDIRDKRDEMYVKPKPKVVAFSGEGRKLGRYGWRESICRVFILVHWGKV